MKALTKLQNSVTYHKNTICKVFPISVCVVLEHLSFRFRKPERKHFRNEWLSQAGTNKWRVLP